MSLSLVSTVTVGSGGAASIDFNSIPQTGTDLLVVFSGRTDYSGYGQFLPLRLNGDSGSNYTNRWLASALGTVSSGTNTTTGFVQFIADGATATSNTHSSVAAYIPNYTSGVAKSISTDLVSEDNSANTYMRIHAGSWSGTAAITSLTISGNSQTIQQYSTASLYTITKGSGGATVS